MYYLMYMQWYSWRPAKMRKEKQLFAYNLVYDVNTKEVRRLYKKMTGLDSSINIRR